MPPVLEENKLQNKSNLFDFALPINVRLTLKRILFKYFVLNE